MTLTGAPRVPGAPEGPAGPDSPYKKTQYQQHTGNMNNGFRYMYR